MALKNMRPGSITKPIRMIKSNIAQLKRTENALKAEGFNFEAALIKDCINKLEIYWNY